MKPDLWTKLGRLLAWATIIITAGLWGAAIALGNVGNFVDWVGIAAAALIIPCGWAVIALEDYHADALRRARPEKDGKFLYWQDKKYVRVTDKKKPREPDPVREARPIE